MISPRRASAAKVRTRVGRSRNCDPASAKNPLATRPSSENWKKRSTEVTTRALVRAAGTIPVYGMESGPQQNEARLTGLCRGLLLFFLGLLGFFLTVHAF